MNTKEITLNRLKEAYKQTHARHIDEAYKQLKQRYDEATPQITTISGVFTRLTDTELKNLCLYV